MKTYKKRVHSHEAYEQYLNDHIVRVRTIFYAWGSYIIADYINYMINGTAFNESAKDTDSLFMQGSEFHGSCNHVLKDKIFEEVQKNINSHDISKFNREEFDAYASYWFPCQEDMLDSNLREANMDRAWQIHWKKNKHHPEYWSWLREKTGSKTIVMPIVYQVEMICDWIAMSYKFYSSTYDWWFKEEEGRKEKAELIPEAIGFIDYLMIKYRDKWDYSTGMTAKKLKGNGNG